MSVRGESGGSMRRESEAGGWARTKVLGVGELGHRILGFWNRIRVGSALHSSMGEMLQMRLYCDLVCAA